MNEKSIIRENSRKFRLRKCLQHKVGSIQKVCTHSSCIESIASSLLCNQCFRKHPENHNGVIQYFLEFDKIFSENVFADIEQLETECLDVLLKKKSRLDAEIDRYCDMVLEEVKQILDSIKFHKKQKYGLDDLIEKIIKLKESLKTEYNKLFIINETNLKDQDIKRYLEFYLKFEKDFVNYQAKGEEIHQSLEKELISVSQLFNQKLKDIKSLLESNEMT